MFSVYVLGVYQHLKFYRKLKYSWPTSPFHELFIKPSSARFSFHTVTGVKRTLPSPAIPLISQFVSFSWHSGDEIANISDLVYRPPSIRRRWADRSQSITPYMKPFVSGCTKGSTYHVSLRVLSASSESGSYPRLDLQAGGSDA